MRFLKLAEDLVCFDENTKEWMLSMSHFTPLYSEMRSTQNKDGRRYGTFCYF